MNPKVTLLLGLATLFLVSGSLRAEPDPPSDPPPTPGDSLLVNDIVVAESWADSLRAEIRKLDWEIQSMKQNFAEVGDIDLLLEALTENAVDPDVPEDTRSRRQRVDTLLRGITERPGQLRFNGSSTFVAQQLVGGDVEEGAGAGSVDLYAHTSFGPSTLLFFAFEAGSGVGIDGRLPFDRAFNADAAPTRSSDGFDLLVMNEAWAEFTALDNAVILTAGKIDLTNYFDINQVANDETAQFLCDAFVNSAALVAPGPGPGLRARTVLLGRFSVQAGLVSSDSTGGTRFSDVFAIGSVGLKIFPETSKSGNLRAYLFSPANVGGATGWGMSLDQQINGPWTVFGRWGENQSEVWETGGARRAWSAGLQWERQGPGHGLTVAAAYGETREEAGSLSTTFEAYASWQLNTWTTISPHVQAIRNESRMARTATAAGVRVQFNF